MENEQPANVAVFGRAQCVAIRIVSFVDEVNISILNSSMCTQAESIRTPHEYGESAAGRLEDFCVNVVFPLS